MENSSWNPNVHGRAHNSSLLVSTWSQMNPVHAFPSSNIILWYALTPPIRSLSFCLSYLYTFRGWSITRQSHTPWWNHSSYTWQSVKITNPHLYSVFSGALLLSPSHVKTISWSLTPLAYTHTHTHTHTHIYIYSHTHIHILYICSPTRYTKCFSD